MKEKRDRERYTELNAKCQRVARRDKKVFLSEQRKENNGMGKTSNIVKITRDSKGTFHTRMGKIKDRKSKDLIDAEDIKKR